MQIQQAHVAIPAAGARRAASRPARAAGPPRRSYATVAAVTVALLLSAPAVMAAGRAEPGRPSPGGSVAGASAGAGMCVELAAAHLPADGWTAILEAILGAAQQRPLFFPDAAMATIPDPGDAPGPGSASTVKVGIWAAGGSDSGGAELRMQTLADQVCLSAGAEWTTTISHDLLLAGSWRLIDSAGLDPELRATVELEVEFHPADDLVQTTLRFATGPFALLHGTCRVDDGLAIDVGTGRAVSSDQLFADLQIGIPDDVCDRFRAFMPEGGAGAQAIALQPVDVSLPDGSIVRFVATTVDVQDAVVLLSGRIARDQTG